MKLTNSQQKALNYSQNILVEAGAGSGKTSLFVKRYCHILTESPHLKPENILAITFTKKAANECYERIQKEYETTNKSSLSHPIDKQSITTIHGFCSTLIKHYGLYISQSPHFNIASQEDSLYLFNQSIKDMLQAHSLSSSDLLTSYLSALPESRLIMDLTLCFKKRDQLPSPSNLNTTLMSTLDRSLYDLFQKTLVLYNEHKRETNTLDYSDLIKVTQKLLLNQHVLKNIQQKYHYIMIDESQDTDPEQWELIKQLCDSFDPFKEKKLCLVGDTKQSIYAFRGAQLSFFNDLKMDFEKNSTESCVIQLNENFRTSPDVLNKLNPMFKHIFEQQGTEHINYHALSPQQTHLAGSVQAHLLKDSSSETDEYTSLANWIKEHLKNNNSNLNDIAVLTRQRSQCDKIKSIFESHGLSSYIDKQKGFFQQTIIVDLFNLTKALTHPNDTLTWISLLNSPLLNIELETIHILIKHTLSVSFSEKLNESEAWNTEMFERYHIKQQEDALKKAIKTINNWISHLTTHSIEDTLDFILTETNAIQHYQNDSLFSQQHAEMFINIVHECESQKQQSHSQLIEQLEFKLNLIDTTFETPQKKQQAIHIMTIHASKGLEFKTVIIAGIHKPFPLKKSDTVLTTKYSIHVSDGTDENKAHRKSFLDKLSNETIEEEKRLFYVACTRTKQHLLLSGIYTQSQNNSYLAFLQSLPEFTTKTNVLEFKDHTQNTHMIPTIYQIQSHLTYNEQTRNSPKQNTTVQLQQLDSTITHTTQQLSASQCETLILSGDSHNNFKSINYSEHVTRQLASYAGEIIHDCVNYKLNSFKITDDNLKELVNNHTHYPHLNKKSKDKINTTIQTICKSAFLKNIAKYEIFTELPFRYTINNTLIHGRIDAVQKENETINIIEIKTDTNQSMQSLLRKYKLQCTLYAGAFTNNSTPNKIIYATIYSTELDASITTNITYKDILKALTPIL